MTEQLNIAELRRLHEAATPGPWETSNLGPTGLTPAIVQREPDDWVPIAYFADDNGDGEAADMEDNRSLIVAARNALPALLDAAEERDAAESLAWDALGRPEGTHDTSNVQRLCEAHGALKAKLEALVTTIKGIDPWPHADEGPVCHSYWGKPCNCLAQPNRDAIAAALAAAKVQP